MFIGRTNAPEEYVDVGKSIEINQGEDPEKEMILNLFRTWSDEFSDQWVTSNQLLEPIQDWDPNQYNLQDSISDFLGRSLRNARSLGKKLKSIKGRVVAGMKLEDREGDKNGKLWRVRSVS